ncbi:hypothetical protein AAVH_43450, partial [Aphelenchoides avenae]
LTTQSLAFSSTIDVKSANHIGLHGGIGNWQWTDGTPVNYTNWDTEDGYPVYDRDCVEFHSTTEGTQDEWPEWYNVGCDDTGFTLLPLCQRDPTL